MILGPLPPKPACWASLARNAAEASAGPASAAPDSAASLAADWPHAGYLGSR
jgi:hypothetical protein